MNLGDNTLQHFCVSSHSGLIQPLFPPLHSLINSLLKRLQMKMEDLSGVEIVGGGWRIPRILEEIGNIVKVSYFFNFSQVMIFGLCVKILMFLCPTFGFHFSLIQWASMLTAMMLQL